MDEGSQAAELGPGRPSTFTDGEPPSGEPDLASGDRAGLLPPSAPRVWRVSDAALAALAVFASGAGVIYFLGDYLGGGVPRVEGLPAWPWSAWGYLVAVVAAVAIVWPLAMSATRFRLPSFWAAAVLTLAVSVILAYYTLLYPIWGGHQGSDSADALELGVRRLLDGLNPYGGVTYLGNPLSPMIGGFLLAAPFVILLGSVALQAIVWLYATILFVARVAGPSGAAAFSVLLFLSPSFRLALVTESDHLVIAAVLLLSGSVGFLASSRDGRRWQVLLVASGIVFSLAMADRFVYLPVAVPLAVLVWRTRPRARAVTWIAVVATSTLALILLPFLGDRDAYLRGPVLTGLNHGQRGDLLVTLALAVGVLGLLAFLSWRTRTLAGAWLASAAYVAALFLGVGLAGAADRGLYAGLTSPEATVYNGAWLILALAGLVIPRHLGLVGRDPGARGRSDPTPRRAPAAE